MNQTDNTLQELATATGVTLKGSNGHDIKPQEGPGVCTRNDATSTAERSIGNS